MDVEELLDVFYVRKTPLVTESEETARPTASTVDKRKTYACIPLLLKHLKTLQLVSAPAPGSYKQIFNNSVNFRFCLVYGRITGMIKWNHRTKYILDDGTECLNVCVFNEYEKFQRLQELENELNAIEEDAQSQVIKSLKQILLKIKEQVDHSNIPIGTKAIVLGRPHIYKSELSINAFSISVDNIHSRANEIAFKCLLLQWYNENVFDLVNSLKQNC